MFDFVRALTHMFTMCQPFPVLQNNGTVYFASGAVNRPRSGCDPEVRGNNETIRAYRAYVDTYYSYI